VTPTPAAVEARGWGWRYAGRRDWAVRGLDLRIEVGERVLLLGGSGAGKSTVLLGVAGLLDASGGGEQEGTLQIGGRTPSAAREATGILFQDPEAQLVMGRAGDDVAFGLENLCLPAETIWPRVDAALDSVGFSYGRERPTNALSGGEQQRLALAGVLALRPALLLLDEPTANLDPGSAAAIRHVIGELIRHRSMTLLLVEHRVGEWLQLVDRVVVIEAGGGVSADGQPLELFARLGDQLAAAGVWVPDRRVVRPPIRRRGTPETMILADQVGFSYPGSSGPAISGVDLRLRSSEALAVVGPNGAGKSTLALLIAGLLTPTTGTVLAGEALAPGRGQEPIARWPARELVKRIGTVFQDPEHQFLTRRVIDELLLGPHRAGIEPTLARRRAEELLARLRLSHLAEANPFTLSGGEKRRLSVATALATAPSVLVLDEPTFGQDLRTWSELLDLLAALRDEGRAICFVTHDRDFAHALADRTLRLAVA
jgi:energy-coupling factor transporter ATP-binding protein EcfA2